MKKTIISAGFYFLLSCGSAQVGVNPPAPVDNSVAPIIERETVKKRDTNKKNECEASKGDKCDGNKKCEKICDDIFSSRSQKRDCYKYSYTLVEDMENLIESVEKGNTDEIESETLECLLDIDDRKFSKAVGKLSRNSAKTFITEIGEDNELARIFEEEDDEFNILKQLLYKATRNRTLTALQKEIDDDKTTLGLFAEANQEAWDWLSDYVSDYCDGKTTGECAGSDEYSIAPYCYVLTSTGGLSDRELGNFLLDADLFSDEYQDEVEDEDDSGKGFFYDATITTSERAKYKGDFKDYCTFVRAPQFACNASYEVAIASLNPDLVPIRLSGPDTCTDSCTFTGGGNSGISVMLTNIPAADAPEQIDVSFTPHVENVVGLYFQDTGTTRSARIPLNLIGAAYQGQYIETFRSDANNNPYLKDNGERGVFVSKKTFSGSTMCVIAAF